MNKFEKALIEFKTFLKSNLEEAKSISQSNREIPSNAHPKVRAGREESVRKYEGSYRDGFDTGQKEALDATLVYLEMICENNGI